MTILGKRIIVGVLAAVLAAGSSGCSSSPLGGSSKKVIEVRNVGEMNGYLYYGESEDESHTGTVASDFVQQVIVDSSMTVEKIYVKEGDIVKKGTKLLKYNMESEELDLKLEDLEVQLQEQKLKKLEEELEKLKKSKTVPDSTTEAEDNDSSSTNKSTNNSVTNSDSDSDSSDSDDDDLGTGTDSDLDSSRNEPWYSSLGLRTGIRDLLSMDIHAEETGIKPTQFDTSNEDYKNYVANAGKNTENGLPVRFYLLGSKGNEASIKGSILKTFCGSSATYIFYQCATEEDLKNRKYDESLTLTINGNNQKTIFDENLVDENMYPINVVRQHQKVLGSFNLSGADDMVKNGKVGRGDIHHFYTSGTYSDGTGIKGIKVVYKVANNTSASTKISKSGVLTVGIDEKINNSLIVSANLNGHVKRLELTVIADDTHDQMESDENEMISNGAANSDIHTVVGDSGSSKDGTSSNSSDNSNSIDSSIDDSTPTVSMLKEEIQEKEEEIWETQKAIAEGKIKYKEDKAKIVKATIKAKFKGTVTKSCTLDTIPTDNTPAIIVKAKTGMFVHFVINEMELDDIQLGGKISCKSWTNSETYDAEITEISPYPVSGDSSEFAYSMTAANPNSSYYPVTAYVEQADGLNSGDQVYILFDSVSMGKTQTGLYLEKKYVRSDGGSYYVFKRGKDKLLHRQTVQVGKSVEEYYEILSGLTDDDYIAFPYPDKDMVEGAETEITEGSIDDGYGAYDY